MKLNLTIWKKLNLILIILLVIGRKVNMAARLMMHYPNKVTCGERTFQQSRLPAINFRVLGAKRMKGLQNVGVIREYVESSETSTQAVAKIPLFQFPLLGTKHLVAYQCLHFLCLGGWIHNKLSIRSILKCE